MCARWLIVVGIVAIAAIAIWQTSRGDGAGDTRADRERPGVSGEGAASPSAPSPPALGSTTDRSASAAGSTNPRSRGAAGARGTFDARVRHVADPCIAVGDPVIPAGHDTLTEAGVTIAWAPRTSGPDEAPWRPVAVAHLVAGLLEEAARLTATTRRAELTVILDPSKEDFHLRTKAPSWATGLYDGAAVHVPLGSGGDLAVNVATLRHEVMHAQLHVAVGCGPFWLHEGLATYFGGAPPIRELFAMLRTGEVYPHAALGDSSVLEQTDDQAGKAYAMSLAMVLHIVDGARDRGVADLVRVASDDTRRDDAGLWARVMPGADERVVVEALARRIFGLARGSELEAALAGPLCCRGLRNVDELQCQPGTNATKPKTQWLCRASW